MNELKKKTHRCRLCGEDFFPGEYEYAIKIDENGKTIYLHEECIEDIDAEDLLEILEMSKTELVGLIGERKVSFLEDEPA